MGVRRRGVVVFARPCNAGSLSAAARSVGGSRWRGNHSSKGTNSYTISSLNTSMERHGCLANGSVLVSLNAATFLCD